MTRLYVWLGEWISVAGSIVSIVTACHVRPAWEFRWFNYWTEGR